MGLGDTCPDVKDSNSCQSFGETARERYARPAHNLPTFLIILFDPFRNFLCPHKCLSHSAGSGDSRHIPCSRVEKRRVPFILRRDAMRRTLKWDMPELTLPHETAWNPKRKNSPTEGFGVVTHRTTKGSAAGVIHCAKCGNEVKVFVSPKRNPHSSKLGRAVSLKDHDLCRRCWRRLMHHQRKVGVVTLPLSLFLGGSVLKPRLLAPVSCSLPREAS